MDNAVSEPTPVATTEPDVTSVAPHETTRLHHLDNLRAIAMLLGVFLHAGLAYANPAQSIWLATDSQSSVLLDATIWFIHLFRMSLFFLLSGYLAKMVIDRRGMKSFLKSRAIRIGLTMVLFYPILLIAMTAAIVFAINYLDAPKGLMGLIVAASRGEQVRDEATGAGTMHLWFLYYLLFFVVASAFLVRVNWLRVKWDKLNPALMAVAPLALLPAVLLAGIPLPAPESFFPTLWPFAFYGLFYWVGWQLRGRETFLERLDRYLWPMVAASGLMYLAYYQCMPVLDLKLYADGGEPPRTQAYYAAAVLTCYLTVSLTFAALLLGQRYLQHRNATLAFVADASFWVYLIHLPIVIFLQSFFIPMDMPVWRKFPLVAGLTIIFCMATYLVFVRYTPVGWLLHGKRKFP
jgi:glucans biosynthesis protein C